MSMFSNAMIASVAMTAVLSAGTASAATVTAGTISGLGGDTLTDVSSVELGTLFNLRDKVVESPEESDGALHLLLDLGSVQPVDKIHVINRIRLDPPTWVLNAAALNVLVAADEGDLGFDPSVLGSFTTEVYSGAFSPGSAASGATQTADLAGIWERRYFLLDITASYNGTINGTEDRDIAQFSDIQVEVVPEPASAALLVIGAGLLARRRR